MCQYRACAQNYLNIKNFEPSWLCNFKTFSYELVAGEFGHVLIFSQIRVLDTVLWSQKQHFLHSWAKHYTIETN